MVAIDPVYAETVNTEIDYHVFLTPQGECQGLYAVNHMGNSFEVFPIGDRLLTNVMRASLSATHLPREGMPNS